MIPRHLLVTNDFPPKIGGIQSYLWELWRRLPPESFAVYTTPHRGMAEFDAAQPFRVIRAPEPVLLPYPWLAARIDRVADEMAADLVVLDPALPLGLIGPSLRHRYGVVLHGAEVAVPGRLPGSRALLAKVLERADPVIAAGGYPAAEGEHAARRALPTTVVPPGVDTDRFVPLDDGARAAARVELGLPTDSPLVVSVSRLVPRKGFDALARATARLRHRFPDLVVAVAGAGRDRGRLERIARETGAPVRFLGRVPDELLPALFGCGDVFAMLCRTRWLGLEQEGFGIVYLEAASCGVPQVAGMSGGAADAVVRGETGLVVDRPDDPAAIAEAIGDLLADPVRRRAMGAAARQRVVDEFAYDVLARRLSSVMADAMIPDVPGHRIISVDWIGTAIFTVVAVAATVWLDEAGPAFIVVSVAVFVIGTVLFLAAYAKAVSRSRFDEISVAGVYLLMGGCASRAVQVRLFGALAVQTVVAVTAASIRPFTDLAYGILVPMFGLGCCGLWGAYHGTFPARTDPRASLPADD